MALVRTAIEITDHEARVLQLRVAKDRVAVKAALRIPLPTSGDADAQARLTQRAEALREGLRAAGLRLTSAVMVIPKRNTTIRYVVLPSADESELGRMARFEAERHIPFNAQRHVISHCVMSKDAIQGSHVLLAAMDSPELDEIRQMSALAGFDVESITVSSLAQYNIISSLAPAATKNQTVGYLHVGLSAADITIVSQGELLFTRSVPFGLERLMADMRDCAPDAPAFGVEDLRKVDLLNPTEGLRQLGLISREVEAPVLEMGHEPTQVQTARDAEDCLREWLNRLSLEIQRSYEFARRELECPPITMLIVAGEGATWPNFSTYLQAGFSVETHAIASLGSIVDEKALLKEPQLFVGAAGALASAWMPRALAVNLIPPDYKARGAIRRQRQSLATTIGLSLLVIALLFVYVKQLSAWRAEQVKGYTMANKKLGTLAELLLDREKQLSIIDGYRNDKRSALAVLDTISKHDYLPRKVSITNFEYVRDRKVRISGWALSIQDLHQFETDLDTATYQGEKIFPGRYREVATDFQQKLPERDQELIKFTVEAYFKP